MIAVRRQSNPVIPLAALWRQRASSLLATNLLSVPKVLAFPESQMNGTTACSFSILAALAQQNLCEIHPRAVQPSPLIPEHSISAKGRQSPAPAPDTLCLWICLFWTFPINGITHCVSFCVWFLSLSIVFSGIWCVVASLNMVSKSCLPTAPLGPSDKPGACLAQDKMPGLPCQYLSWEGHGYWAAQDTGSPPSGLCPPILHLLLWEDFTENPSDLWIPSLP
ncbi:uncharacterized protein [Pseudorca crassidens]|uniref:uncharacterized protein n=1 Tax=Pseudorca crassidens TaxID=82174 RepID=UPI00352F8B8E